MCRSVDCSGAAAAAGAQCPGDQWPHPLAQALTLLLQVTIVTAQLSPHPTGDGAAGLFSLFLMWDTPVDKQVSCATLDMTPGTRVS